MAHPFGHPENNQVKLIVICQIQFSHTICNGHICCHRSLSLGTWPTRFVCLHASTLGFDFFRVRRHCDIGNMISAHAARRLCPYWWWGGERSCWVDYVSVKLNSRGRDFVVQTLILKDRQPNLHSDSHLFLMHSFLCVHTVKSKLTLQ